MLLLHLEGSWRAGRVGHRTDESSARFASSRFWAAFGDTWRYESGSAHIAVTTASLDGTDALRHHVGWFMRYPGPGGIVISAHGDTHERSRCLRTFSSTNVLVNIHWSDLWEAFGAAGSGEAAEHRQDKFVLFDACSFGHNKRELVKFVDHTGLGCAFAYDRDTDVVDSTLLNIALVSDLLYKWTDDDSRGRGHFPAGYLTQQPQIFSEPFRRRYKVLVAELGLVCARRLTDRKVAVDEAVFSTVDT